jgi:hypothetical protein
MGVMLTWLRRRLGLEPLGHVNRSAFLVRPGRGYLEWMRRRRPGYKGSAFDTVVYLLPQVDDDALRAYLDDAWPHIFEHQLLLGSEDRSDWPRPRTRAMFDAWFEVHGSDWVSDWVRGRLRSLE